MFLFNLQVDLDKNIDSFCRNVLLVHGWLDEQIGT